VGVYGQRNQIAQRAAKARWRKPRIAPGWRDAAGAARMGWNGQGVTESDPFANETNLIPRGRGLCSRSGRIEGGCPPIGLGCLGRFQPRHFCFEFESQLGAFVLGQPVRHLWENCAVERDPCRPPRELLCGPRLGENLVQPRSHRVRIGAVLWSGLLAEQVGLFVAFEEIGLMTGRSHASHGSEVESCESCAILPIRASRKSGLSP